MTYAYTLFFPAGRHRGARRSGWADLARWLRDAARPTAGARP